MGDITIYLGNKTCPSWSRRSRPAFKRAGAPVEGAAVPPGGPWPADRNARAAARAASAACAEPVRTRPAVQERVAAAEAEPWIIHFDAFDESE